MSHDLQIATHRRPTRYQLAAWAEERGLLLEDEPGEAFLVSRPSARTDGCLLEIYGPVAVEPEGLDEQVAAACRAPRWMTTAAVPSFAPARAMALARALARHLAEADHGAAIDLQDETLIWPRARRRPPAGTRRGHERRQPEMVPAPRALGARASALLDVLALHCPQALPRYGLWNPCGYRFGPADPDRFVNFVIVAREGFWDGEPPSLGGSWWDPGTPWHGAPEGGRRAVALEVQLDGEVLERDPRWREAVVDMFASATARMGAFFAAAQVERGWEVNTRNRIETRVNWRLPSRSSSGTTVSGGACRPCRYG